MQENSQLKLCSCEANCWPNLMPLGVPAHSLLTVNRLERSTSSPLPSLSAPSAPAAHPLWRWKTTTLLGDTTSWGLCPYERALNKMHSIHVVLQADGVPSKMDIVEKDSTICAHPQFFSLLVSWSYAPFDQGNKNCCILLSILKVCFRMDCNSLPSPGVN